MKNLFLLALVACLGFIACDTPSPATTNPSDSTSNPTQAAPDTAKVDTTKNQ
ncbi:hypothetical protein [Flavitalea sp.]|nr:hypothetical protein [Flavitalea sp.]